MLRRFESRRQHAEIGCDFIREMFRLLGLKAVFQTLVKNQRVPQIINRRLERRALRRFDTLRLMALLVDFLQEGVSSAKLKYFRSPGPADMPSTSGLLMTNAEYLSATGALNSTSASQRVGSSVCPFSKRNVCFP